ncbi:lipase [Nocardioides baekrokdamisoli]|uniref:Lipase n=1 Tax=Nocardioides baekrokdamisoli TaxID=1804624 RepID=A0A3G9IPR8_9ACTN|nr:alpha/beta fold hydrolase [Nocardioides baekrokdamisoli]BBH18055.1 lipase [Nocardioides baekrokdamisoli]
MQMLKRVAGIAGAGVVVLGVVAGPAHATPTYPVASSEAQMEYNEATFYATGQDPAQSAPGVNVACTPSAAHPYPVVLVHGLNGNQYNGWANIGPSLANLGYCVYSLNYVSTDRIAASSQQIASFINQVMSTTRAAKVDLVGHSEGGFQVEYVPKMIPGMAAKVHAVVALAPPSHGTTLWGLSALIQAVGLNSTVASGCGACADLLAGSSAVQALDNGPIAQPGIAYTTIISKYDEAITPYTSAAINEPGVTNIVVQDLCPADPVGHTGLAYDSGPLSMIENALDPAHAIAVACGIGPVG